MSMQKKIDSDTLLQSRGVLDVEEGTHFIATLAGVPIHTEHVKTGSDTSRSVETGEERQWDDNPPVAIPQQRPDYELTAGSTVRITRSISKKAPGQPPGPGSIFEKVGEETFVGEVTSVHWIGKRQRGFVEEIDGSRRQSISYPPSNSMEIEVLELADAPERTDIRFGVPVDEVVRGKWDAGEWMPEDEIPEGAEIVAPTTPDEEFVYCEDRHGPVEHVAEWNGEGYTVDRVDRDYRPWEITATPEGEISTSLVTGNVHCPTSDWSKEEAVEAYRSEMKAVTDALRAAL